MVTALLAERNDFSAMFAVNDTESEFSKEIQGGVLGSTAISMNCQDQSLLEKAFSASASRNLAGTPAAVGGLSSSQELSGHFLLASCFSTWGDTWSLQRSYKKTAASESIEINLSSEADETVLISPLVDSKLPRQETFFADLRIDQVLHGLVADNFTFEVATQLALLYERRKDALEDVEAQNIAHQAMLEAARFLQRQRPASSPHLMLSEDGFVILQWRNNGVGVLVQFFGDGLPSYSLKNSSLDYPTNSTEFEADRPVPADLQSAIQSVS